AGAREFLRGHDLHELVGGNAAIFFGKAEAEKPDLGGLGIERARKLAGLVPFAGIGLDLSRHEAAHHVAKGFMLRRVERALRPCALQHGFLPVRDVAPIWRSRTCVKPLTLSRDALYRHSQGTACCTGMARPASERKTSSA